MAVEVGVVEEDHQEDQEGAITGTVRNFWQRLLKKTSEKTVFALTGGIPKGGGGGGWPNAGGGPGGGNLGGGPPTGGCGCYKTRKA